MRITHPHHPLHGQVVEVLRSYRRQQGETQLEIQLPDGTRVFIPVSWAEPVAAADQAAVTGGEPMLPWVNAATLLSLAKLVAAFTAHPDQERSRSHDALPDAQRDGS